MILLGFAFTLALGLQDPPSSRQEPPPTELEQVVVEGRQLRDAIDRFVDDVVAPPVGRGPARWSSRVCVGVVNLRREAAQALADQVSSVADQIGLEVGEPGCKPNVLIIGSNDGQGLARALVAAKPRLFRPQYSGAARSSEALAGFQDTLAPVRWWHVSMPVVRDTGEPGVRLPGQGPPFVPGSGRLRTELRNDLQRVIIIIDMDDASDLNFRQLGDYIGMITLAQIDPDAEMRSYDTVLNLFEHETDVGGLTGWDVSYLTSLYAAELNQRAVNQQQGEIASAMLRDRRTVRPNDR